MNLHSEFEALPTDKLIDALSICIYEPPLTAARDCLREIAEPLRVPILVLDFDTELNMNGMLGFLENSTGLFFPETIEAFKTIGAFETVAVLQAIGNTLERHGVTPSRLRGDFDGTQEHQITSFQELHGDLGTLPDEVEEDAKRLYLYAEPNTGEDVWALLGTFVEQNRAGLLDEIDRIAGER